MRFSPTIMLTGGDMSAATVSSLPMDCNQIGLAAIQAVWTGSPVGSIFLEISNDETNTQSAIVNWSTYTGSAQAVSGVGNFTWNLNWVGYRWIRVTYTKTSGTGTLGAIFSGKG